MKPVFFIFYILVTKTFCCDEIERNIIANLNFDCLRKYILYTADDTYTSMSFFNVVFNYLNYTDKKQELPFVLNFNQFKSRYGESSFKEYWRPNSTGPRFMSVEMPMNESAYGYFYGCDLCLNKQYRMLVYTKDHPLFPEKNIDKFKFHDMGFEFKTENCDCKLIKQAFIEQCSKKLHFSNDLVIFLLVLVVFIAFLYRWLTNFIKVENA